MPRPRLPRCTKCQFIVRSVFCNSCWDKEEKAPSFTTREVGEKCCCGEPEKRGFGIVHRKDGPCYYHGKPSPKDEEGKKCTCGGSYVDPCAFCTRMVKLGIADFFPKDEDSCDHGLPPARPDAIVTVCKECGEFLSAPKDEEGESLSGTHFGRDTSGEWCDGGPEMLVVNTNPKKDEEGEKCIHHEDEDTSGKVRRIAFCQKCNTMYPAKPLFDYVERSELDTLLRELRDEEREFRDQLIAILSVWAGECGERDEQLSDDLKTLRERFC